MSDFLLTFVSDQNDLILLTLSHFGLYFNLSAPFYTVNYSNIVDLEGFGFFFTIFWLAKNFIKCFNYCCIDQKPYVVVNNNGVNRA